MRTNIVHGSPYDRGSADSYYQRGPCPHWYPEGTYKGERVTEERMTADQIAEYHLGFTHNEQINNFKEWE
jgi:hypothetical protein